jgi:hypothetical protein
LLTIRHPDDRERVMAVHRRSRETGEVSRPGEGEHIWFLGSLVTIKVPGDAVEGRYAMLEFLMPRVIEEVMRTHDHCNVGPPLGPGD